MDTTSKSPVSPRTLAVGLSLLGVTLITSHLFGLWWGASIGKDVPFFDLNDEKNFPSFFSALYLAFSGYLCWLVAKEKKTQQDSYALHWKSLACIFFFLACDEYFLIHDGWSRPIRQFFQLSGAFYYAWVIPYSILLMVFAVFFFKFVFYSLPTRTRNQFIASGTLFVLGAIGFEMIGAIHKGLHGRSSAGYIAYTTIEESLEILGINLFIYFLYSYLVKYYPTRALSKPFFIKLGIVLLVPLAYLTWRNLLEFGA